MSGAIIIRPFIPHIVSEPAWRMVRCFRQLWLALRLSK